MIIGNMLNFVFDNYNKILEDEKNAIETGNLEKLIKIRHHKTNLGTLLKNILKYPDIHNQIKGFNEIQNPNPNQNPNDVIERRLRLPNFKRKTNKRKNFGSKRRSKRRSRRN